MKRLHIHISVKDLNESIHFYSSLFAAEPTVRKPDYAKWMLDNPRVNFAISKTLVRSGVDHLGMQVESEEELSEVRDRLTSIPSPVRNESGANCCYAKSDKHWVTDPQGVAWETFHTLETIPMFGTDARELQNAACQLAARTSCC